MFKIYPGQFVTQQITIPVNLESINSFTIQHFDNDGFQLNDLEQEYYLANGIAIELCLGVWAAHYPWITLEPGTDFIIDHSIIVSRCSYAGHARAQLERGAGQFPQLRKFLMLRPKWGIDFALEHAVGTDDYIEVLHIEKDYSDYEQAVTAKEAFEQRILSTDWKDFTARILERRDEWENLQGMARNDWKAQYWGLDRAESTLKAF